MSDESLEATVERCRQGDQHAWAELVDATADDIYRLAVSFTRNRAEAEDLTQDVFLKLWQNLHRYIPGSSFRAWAYRVARNLFVDAYRRARDVRQATWIDPEFLDMLPGSDDPHTQAVRNQRLQIARTALARLPEELAQLLLLRDFADWSYEELAAELDVPLGTIKSRLNRARRELASVVGVHLVPRAPSPAGATA
ncbi:MAG: sigma-70 family RNA polymerase sigma factor [Thermoanaerobaculaceae bacterium]|jgi:RNA polymerase sigma-70 factor (ECF subfamily)|nr:sigma-70 family RNA polymerase sigma factor [Thermoanaerobaculaceae bacterium]